MKNTTAILFLILLFNSGFSQNFKYEYRGRSIPSTNKEILNEAKSIGDVTTKLWQRLLLAHKERIELDQRGRKHYIQGYYIYPLGYNYIYPYDINYNKLIDYVSVEISAICNGKILKAKSRSDKLTTEQKNILNTTDPNTDISIKIKFKYKNSINESTSNSNKITEGELTVAVVPETEAEYPGGFNQLTKYLIENVFNKISETSAFSKIQQAVVKFTVNEEGQVVDPTMVNTSTDSKIDKLLLDAITKMPKWKPAENEKGIKVKQEFSIPLDGGGGC